MPTSKSCTIVRFAVSPSMSRTHDLTRLSPTGIHPSASESQRRSSAHIASWTRLSAVSRVDLDPSCGALGGTVVDRIPRFCGVTSTTPGGTPVTVKRVKVLVGPLPVDTMNCVFVERSDWTGCTENKVGSGPKLIVRATAPLRRSVLFRTQYWTPRYDGLALVHEAKSFAETMTTRSLNPRSGWSAQPVIVDTRYGFQEPVGSSVADTSRRTLPDVTSAMEANQRPLAVSKWIFGSLMKSVEGTLKNVSSGKVCTSTPCFVEIRPRTFTISTTWFGPTAIWTSGGVRRFVYRPFVRKWRPSKPSTGMAALGVQGDGPAWTGRIRRSLSAATELSFNADEVCGSAGSVPWRGLSSRDWIAVAEFDIAGAIASPTTTESARTSRHGWGEAMLAERWLEPCLNPLPKLADGRKSLPQWTVGVARRTRRRDARAGIRTQV